MSKLFTKLKIRELNLRNRIVMSPMCQYSSQDGFANDWHLQHYVSRAYGGCGLVIFEATAISEEGRISFGDLGIWSDEHIKELKKITSQIEKAGSYAGIQIAHAGRKAGSPVPWSKDQKYGGLNSVAPSSIKFSELYETPKELNETGFEKIRNDFKNATKRAFEAGFKVLEIHGAHGYLLSEFLSPLTNTRTDQYGGSLENRMRFPLEVVKIVREIWPMQLPLFIRISATDWVEGGWGISDSIEFAKRVKELGVDLIDCSSGGVVESVKVPVGPLFQVPFSNEIKHQSKILTGTVGEIKTAEQAEQILQENKADLIFLGRPLLRNPYWALEAFQKLGPQVSDTPWPVQYLRGQ